MKKIILLIAVSLMVFPLLAKPNKKEHHMKGKGEHHKKMMEKLDTDKDGKISSDEWMAMFKKIDANNDGKIDDSEFKAHHEKMKKEHHGKNMDDDEDDDK